MPRATNGAGPAGTERNAGRSPVAISSAEALKDFEASLGPLGKPVTFTQAGQSLRGGMVLRRFQITFPGKTLSLTTFTMPDGRLEQYQIAAVE